MERTDFEQMLDALSQGDRTAFRQFYDRYGLPVYRYLLDKTGDPARARRLWKDVFRTLTERMRADDRPDLPLLLLTALADLQLHADACESVETQAERLFSEWMDGLTAAAEVPEIPETEMPEISDIEAAAPVPDDAAEPPDAHPSAEPDAPADVQEPAVPDAPDPDLTAPRRPRSRRWIVPVLVVSIVIVCGALWVGAGFAMAGGMLPEFDLGYSWFNRTVFHLFPLM